MEKIHTIDLWTEQYKNHYECFNGMRELLEWLGVEIKTMEEKF